MRTASLRRHGVAVGRDDAVEDGLALPLNTEVDRDRIGRGGGCGDSEDGKGHGVRAPDAVGHWPPFPRGSYGSDRGQVSWLRTQRRAFPESRRLPSGISDASAPVHSGGAAPASHPTSLSPPALDRGNKKPPMGVCTTGRYNRA